MKLVMTLLVRDEEDILRENLDFHLARGVDQIVLMDNLSADGTADIAREYERAGYLRYFFQAQDDYSQAQWVTEMARRAIHELRADWVINSDADEFWWPHAGTLKDALGSIRADAGAASAQRTNFVPRGDGGEPFWRRMNVRHTRSVNPLGQPLPGKVAHRALTEVLVAQGNHGVSDSGRAVLCAPAPITIFHFPLRSRAQFVNKIAKGGAAYARNTALAPEIGATWRHLYELYLGHDLDQVYARELLSDDQILDGLEAGTLVRDERLAGVLASR